MAEYAAHPTLLSAAQARLYRAWVERFGYDASGALTEASDKPWQQRLRTLQALVELGFLVPSDPAAPRYRSRDIPQSARGEHPLMRQRFYAVERPYREKPDHSHRRRMKHA